MEKNKQYTCPICGAGGASSYVPLCHMCDFKVYMLESINGKIMKVIIKKYKSEQYVNSSNGLKLVSKEEATVYKDSGEASDKMTELGICGTDEQFYITPILGQPRESKWY